MNYIRKVTYIIDDEKGFKKSLSDKALNGMDFFKAKYTLTEDENGITYTLTDFNDKKININSLNGYQYMYINECFNSFNKMCDIAEEFKVVAYCRLGNPEQIEKPFTNIKKYIPYDGFFDLRKFDLSQKEFERLWKIQDYLYEQSKHKDYLKTKNPVQWMKLKEMSADYQAFLLSHKSKIKSVEQEQDIELEME